MIKIRILICALACCLSLPAQETTDSIPPAKTGLKKACDIAGIALPALMVTYGIVSIESDGLKALDYSTEYELHEDSYMFYHHLDDYLQFSPAAAAFTMKLAGVPSKHNLVDMAALYALSNGAMAGVTYAGKTAFGRTRPDGSTANSFPSGHTATAFCAAAFLHEEYGDRSLWISAGGYTMATLIGFSRIFNDRHWVSDIVAGAGVGILSVKLVYWLYPYAKGLFCKKSTAFLVPYYQNGDLGLSFACSF
ncbi:MAG: phosphatase PAP2 family protein [Prevotellaceae bacterium]|jgi:hypothetical protein|nr:phosphatase PAP2 family protein [Prevotellaceae bacterium]